MMSDVNLENGQSMESVAPQKGSFDERGIDLLLDIPLEVSVEVGRSRILVRDLLQLQEGSLVELDKLAGEPLDLYVNSRLIARGEAVVVNEKFGLRLTDVVSPSERIEKLG
ncbi:MAG: flagellar motor switch protein FliN [Desulfuromusa sp.]|nr:flagellar motor switch protein FliN [Desulfuromusa sp.]